jgi:hypothetical protein
VSRDFMRSRFMTHACGKFCRRSHRHLWSRLKPEIDETVETLRVPPVVRSNPNPNPNPPFFVSASVDSTTLPAAIFVFARLRLENKLEESMVLDDRAGLASKLNGRFNYNTYMFLDEQVRQAVRTIIKPFGTYVWCGSARPA